MASAREVVNYLVHLRNENLEDGIYSSLSNLKIQKLLYFCQGVYAVSQNGAELIEDVVFEAWRYGPVIPEVYYRFNSYGQNDIPVSEVNNFDNLTDTEKAIIEQVWLALRDRSAFDLVEISHAEDGPWANAYEEGRNNEINHELIHQYFGG